MATADSDHQQVTPETRTSSMSYSNSKEGKKGVYYHGNDDTDYLDSQRASESVQPQPRTTSFQHRARRSGVFTPPHPRRVPKPLTLRSPATSSNYTVVSPSPDTFGMENSSRFSRDGLNPADRWKTAASRARQAKRYSGSRPPSVLSCRYSSNKRGSLVNPINSATSTWSENRPRCAPNPSVGSKMYSSVSFNPPLTSKSSASEQSGDRCVSASPPTAHRRLPSIDTASNYSLESDQGPDDADLSITVVEEPITSPKSTAPLRTRHDYSGHAEVDSNANIDLPASLWTTGPLNSPVDSVSTPHQSPRLARAASGSLKSPVKSTSPRCTTSSSKLVKKKHHGTPSPSPKSTDEKKTKTLKARRSFSQLILRKKSPKVADVAEEEFCGLKGFHDSWEDEETEELRPDVDSHVTEHTSPTMTKVVNFHGIQGPHSKSVERLVQSHQCNDLKQDGEVSSRSKSSIDLTSATEHSLSLRPGRRPSIPESPAPKSPGKKLNINSNRSLAQSPSSLNLPMSQPPRGLAPDLDSDLVSKESDLRTNYVKRTHSFQAPTSASSVSKHMNKSSLSQGFSKALERSFSQSYLQKSGLDVEKTQPHKDEKAKDEMSKRDSAGRGSLPSPASKKPKTKDEPIARNLFMFWKKKKTSSICSKCKVSCPTPIPENFEVRRSAVLKISDPIPITLVPQGSRDTVPRPREQNNEKTASVRKHDNPSHFKSGKSSQNSVSLLQQQISLTRTRSDITYFTQPHPAPSLPEMTRSNSMANQLSLIKPPRPPRRRPVAAA